MKASKKLSLYLIILVVLNTILPVTVLKAAPIPIPLISKEVPAFASVGTASDANDGNYGTSWKGNPPGWLAYDLSKVPESQRTKVIVVWYNSDTYDYDPTIKNNGFYGMPKSYTIEANPAAGGSSSAPTSGWVTLATVTNNVYHSRQHVVNLSGYNWVRINVTAVNGSGGSYISLNMDVHDVSNGIEDNWIFYGDSITAGGMAPNGTGTGTFAQMINKVKPGNFPIAEGGGIGAILSSHGAANISTWLSVFPGKYVGLAYGTNDAWGNQAGTSTYYKNMESMVKVVLAAGKVPVVPKIPYSKNQDISKYAPSYNEQIDALYKAYPAIVKGPDLWTYFQNNPSLLSSDNVHPSAEGYVGMRQKWADTMLASVYAGSSSTPTPNGIKVSGFIAPDFSSDALKSGFTVEVTGDNYSGKAETDNKGYFELTNVTASGLSIKISKPGFLTREISKTSSPNGIVLGTSASPVDMWGGDVRIDGVSDGKINMADVIEIAKGFNSVFGETKYSTDYDLNQDKSVNMSDIIIIARHFGVISSNYPGL